MGFSRLPPSRIPGGSKVGGLASCLDATSTRPKYSKRT